MPSTLMPFSFFFCFAGQERGERGLIELWIQLQMELFFISFPVQSQLQRPHINYLKVSLLKTSSGEKINSDETLLSSLFYLGLGLSMNVANVLFYL